MIEPRLSAEMKVKTLLRLVTHQGGFGAVLKKGDRISSAYGRKILITIKNYLTISPKDSALTRICG